MYYKGRRDGDKAQLAKAKAKHELTGSTRTLVVGTAGVAGQPDLKRGRILPSKADSPIFRSTVTAVLLLLLHGLFAPAAVPCTAVVHEHDVMCRSCDDSRPGWRCDCGGARC